MNEVMEKLNDLIVMLENKIVQADMIVNKSIKKEEELSQIIARQKLEDKSLSAREDAVKSKESAEELLAKAVKIRKESQELDAAVAQDRKNLQVIKESVDKKSKEIDELTNLYKRKLASVDQKEIELAEEKKNLRKVILDEIKGKL
jgi:hypothetical protein